MALMRAGRRQDPRSETICTVITPPINSFFLQIDARLIFGMVVKVEIQTVGRAFVGSRFIANSVNGSRIVWRFFHCSLITDLPKRPSKMESSLHSFLRYF